MRERSLQEALGEELEACWQLSCTGSPDEALTRGREIYERAKTAMIKPIIALAAQQIAWYCIQLGRAEDGVEPIHEAQQLWTELCSLREAASATAIYSRLLFELGMIDEAYHEAAEALSVGREMNDPSLQSFALDVQAITMIYSGEMDSGRKLIDEAYALQEQYDDPSMHILLIIHDALMNAKAGDQARDTGDIAAFKEHYRHAVALNERAVAMAEATNDGYRLRLALCNGAEAHCVSGDIEKAHDFIERWLAVPGAAGDSRMVHFLYSKTEILTHAGRTDEALEIGEQALLLAERTGITDHIANAHRRLSEVHEAMGDFDSALLHYKRFHTLDKKLIGEQARRRARVAEIRFETDKVKALLDQATRRADQLAQEALRDPLTGIANRRALDRELLKLASRVDREYAIAIIDLDHFKAINDRHSHMVGDDVLKKIAEALHTSCRTVDLVARMGGEEFAVLLPETSRAAALKVCERMRKSIVDANWEELAPGLKVTASIGLADSSEGNTPLDVFSVADSRLYAAKAGGRDRIESQGTHTAEALVTLH